MGTLWSDAAWGARFYAVNPTVKLLVLPVLLYHFARSPRGHWVFVAFLVSCALLSVMSWLVAFYPDLALKSDRVERGIFVKNYIDQSQEFTLCAVALAYPIVQLLREKRYWIAGLFTALALALLRQHGVRGGIAHRARHHSDPVRRVRVASSEMAQHRDHLRRPARRRRSRLAGLAAIAQDRRQLRQRLHALCRKRRSRPRLGLRLEFWRKSLGFFAEAPIKGHGTGSTRGLFERVATPGDQYLASAEVIGNPHNQTLNVAVQWGIIGVAVLYAIWILHLLLFRGDGLANWVGLLVVVQNVFTSLFNSHLFDFHEGWMYVIGVGVAGGMVIRAQQAEAKAAEAGS